MYNSLVICLNEVDLALKDKNLSFIKYCFLYGSATKGKLHKDSDIDLLLLGTREKNIDTLCTITSILDSYNTTRFELDIKYYKIDTFKKLKDKNLFLQSIGKTAMKLEEAKNELLRFCT